MDHSQSSSPAQPPGLDEVRCRSEDSKEMSISSKDESTSGQRTLSKIVVPKFPGESELPPASLHEYVDDSDLSVLLTTGSVHEDQSQSTHIDLDANFVFPDASEIDEDDDEPLETFEQQQTALQFAMEHKIFLRAALSLLTERDARAPTLGMMDPMVLKSGPLKKASHLMNGVWKVKYVEIRRGMLTYYENSISDGEILRKNIPLSANDCKCRPVRLHQKALKFTPRGAIFEISAGGSKRLWMATSREERQNWMRAIHTATVGGSVTTSGTDHSGRMRNVSPRSPFRQDLRLYLKTQGILKQARTKDEYMAGLKELASTPIRAPIKWIAKQTVLSTISNQGDMGMNQSGGPAAAFQELDVNLSVDQLWRDLQRDSVSINGVIWQGNASHGPEAIVGAVAHSILRSSRQSIQGESDMMESQSLAYSRDIMLSGNRTRSGGDSYFCISTLCDNSELIVLTPSAREAEPVAISVKEENSAAPQAEGRVKSKSGWMKRRTKLQRSWKAFFFVLSEGMLSFYDGALPRPHGLRGVIPLVDATISARRGHKGDGYFVVKVASKDGKDHFLRLENEGRLIEWLYALEREAKAKMGSETPSRFNMRRKSASKDDDAPNSAASIDGKASAEQATLEHAKHLGLDVGTIAERITALSCQTTSAVRIDVQALTEYNICTLDPSGDTAEDTWAVIRAHFRQSFRVTGGPAGSITRGEEIVHVSLLQIDGVDIPEEDQNAPDSKKNRKSRIFRKSVGKEDGSELDSR